MARWRSRHFTAVTALGPQEVELEHSKVVVSWLLSFHGLFRLPPPKQAICAVRCASQKITFAMRCIFVAICVLIAEIHCDVGHDASITAIAMLRCGELRFYGCKSAEGI